MSKKLTETSVLRVIDAAFNRTSEGLRVVEDYFRMIRDDAHLVRLLKSIRHELKEVSEQFDFKSRVEARESVADVGRTIQTNQEYQRLSHEDILRANFGRAQQGLRSIEEFSKLENIAVSQKVESLRYRVYTLEKAASACVAGQEQIPNPAIYVLTDLRSDRADFELAIDALLEAKVDFIQLRDKTASDRELVEAGKRLTERTRESNTRWIMNDRPDLAAISGADGVHVGQSELSVKDCRLVLGAGKLIGVSTHSIEQAEQAVLDGANYIGVGPVFPSTTKSFEQFPGVDLVRSVASTISLPAFAIGGIASDNVSEVVNAGIRRIAVSSAVMSGGRIGEAVGGLRELLSLSKV